MSSHTVATLPRMTARDLHSLLLSPSAHASSSQNPDPTNRAPTSPELAIIDVRDADYIGGHIRSSQHIPLATFDYRAPELVRTLKNTDVVVFHCMLSQQRGPTAALRYLRERERMGVGIGEKDMDGTGNREGQKVYVLDGGFEGWQRRYGTDDMVTEGYRKELWED